MAVTVVLVAVAEIMGWLFRHQFYPEPQCSTQVRLVHYTSVKEPWNYDETVWFGEGRLGSGLYCYRGWTRPALAGYHLTIDIEPALWNTLSGRIMRRRWSWEYTRTLLLYTAYVLRFPRATRDWIERSLELWDYIEAPMLAAPSCVRQVVLRSTDPMAKV